MSRARVWMKRRGRYVGDEVLMEAAVLADRGMYRRRGVVRGGDAGDLRARNARN